MPCGGGPGGGLRGPCGPGGGGIIGLMGGRRDDGGGMPGGRGMPGGGGPVGIIGGRGGKPGGGGMPGGPGGPGGPARGGGTGGTIFALGSTLKANCRKNCLVSLFHVVHDLSTSRLGTLKAMVSYGSAANRRYCHLRSGGSTFCS